MPDGVHGLRRPTRSARTLPAAVPRPRRRQQRRPARARDAIADIDGGKMDGFIRAGAARPEAAAACATRPPRLHAGAQQPDVMGYHDAREIPNYWAYAQHFVLQDHMFEPNASWSLPAHLFMVSEWSARCYRARRPDELRERDREPGRAAARAAEPDRPRPDYAWTDLTYLLHQHHVPLGATTSSPGTSRTATTARDDLRARSSRARRRRGSGTRCRTSTRCAHDDQLREHPADLAASTRGRAPGRCRRSRGSTPNGHVSEHPPSLGHARPGLRHAA